MVDPRMASYCEDARKATPEIDRYHSRLGFQVRSFAFSLIWKTWVLHSIDSGLIFLVTASISVLSLRIILGKKRRTHVEQILSGSSGPIHFCPTQKLYAIQLSDNICAQAWYELQLIINSQDSRVTFRLDTRVRI